jgi:hypothetical protein
MGHDDPPDHKESQMGKHSVESDDRLLDRAGSKPTQDPQKDGHDKLVDVIQGK